MRDQHAEQVNTRFTIRPCQENWSCGSGSVGFSRKVSSSVSRVLAPEDQHVYSFDTPYSFRYVQRNVCETWLPVNMALPRSAILFISECYKQFVPPGRGCGTIKRGL